MIFCSYMMKILHSYTPSSIIAVFIPDKRQNMFHELRNWRNHCLHSLLKVPISKIFLKSYIFFVHKVRRLRVSRLPLLEILVIWIQTLVNWKPDFDELWKWGSISPKIHIYNTAWDKARILSTLKTTNNMLKLALGTMLWSRFLSNPRIWTLCIGFISMDLIRISITAWY